MTLLGAVPDLTNNSIVIGADRRAGLSTNPTGTRYVDYVDKMYVVANAPGLMWGWSGAEIVGEPLRAWFETADVSSWARLKGGLSSELGGRNSALAAAQAGAIAECLVAGFIDSHPGILWVRAYGASNWQSDDPETEPCFIGQSSVKVDFAWRFATTVPPKGETTSDNFCHLMRLAITEDLLLGGFTAWAIHPNSVPEQIDFYEPSITTYPTPQLGGVPRIDQP